jgi:hypothetical protein
VTPKVSALGSASLALLCVVVWAVSHSYVGLFHDAILYTLQALARSDPSSLSHDVFLRFGSQDRFSIFSSLYAAAANAWGIERSAAALTLTFQLALIVSAWWLARTVTNSSLALLGCAIFIAVPAQYGADRVFTCIEAFVTPRMAAEALVLASIACALHSRRKLAFAFLAVAALFHPIMAAAGIAALCWLYIGLRHPRLVILIMLLAALLLIAEAALMPMGQWGRFDPTWWVLVKNRSPYLFLVHWNLDDWSRALLSITTLAIGVMSLPVSKARSLALVALLVVLSGLALSLLTCDVLHLTLFTQLQSWRWQWLGSIAAALLMPKIIESQWHSSKAGSAAALLLVSAWVFESGELSLIALTFAIACQAFSARIAPQHARLFFYGACGMLAISILWRLASDFEFTESHYIDSNLPAAFKKLMSFCRDGLAPVALIVAAWWWLRFRSRSATIVVGCLSAAAAALVLPTMAEPWFEQEFSPTVILQFAQWRAKLPVAAEVLSVQSPLPVWLLLSRPNYISTAQSSGIVFSRATALELQHRAETLKDFIPPEGTLGWESGGAIPIRSRQQLEGICDLGAFDYLMTGMKLNREPIAIQPGKSPDDPRALKLYECRPQARAAAAAAT